MLKEKKFEKEVKIIKNKIMLLGIISIFFIAIHSTVNAKYIFNNEFLIANLNIDRTKPKIEVIDIKNTNKGYDKYANKTHTITLKVKIIEKNVKEINLNNRFVDIFVSNQKLDEAIKNVKEVEKIDGNRVFEIQLVNLKGNGNLQVIFKEGTVIDNALYKNEKLIVDTKITIDNIAPIGNWKEQKISDGKVNGIINISEGIRKLDGWTFSNDSKTITKEFTNNISYELPIMDYAENSSIVKVDVKEASYIKLTYASHNSEIGWTYGHGNYDIAGKEAIMRNDKLKTEAIAFRTEGNMDEDFVRANAYIHTYWGGNSVAKCKENGILYKNGYNPNINEFKTMKSPDTVNIAGKKYFQLGGTGVNMYGNTDINGKNPIPYYESNQYLFGVSGITLRLKEYSQFAIIYQVYQSEFGWATAKSNGEECYYKKNLPISAFRIALVPKSEKQYVLDMWNKDVGTKNLK